jgi:hypothetical protein
VATTQAGGTTNVRGKNPDSHLCNAIHTNDLAVSKQESNLLKIKFKGWRSYQKLMLYLYGTQSQTAQAVIEVGTGVPTNIRSAARKEVSDGKVLHKLILKSKNIAGLDESLAARGTGFLSGWNAVLQYVGAQCGSVESSGAAVAGASTNPN